MQLVPSLIFTSCMVAASAEADYSQYVNPFMGGSGPDTSVGFGGGDIFVGGALPFGVVKLGIDTFETPNLISLDFSTINGGWTPRGLVTGVSMTHESGTGGEPKYGVVSQMPLTSIDAPVSLLDNTTYWQKRVGDDVASVGYFKTVLESGVTIELSAARHSGILQYTFPAGEKHVLVDVSHYLPQEGGAYSSQVYLGGEIAINGSQYTGYGTYGGGFNEGAPYTVFFCGEFEQAPDEVRTFTGRNTDPMARQHSFSNGPIGQAVFTGKSAKSGPLLDRVGAVFSWSSSPTNSQLRSKIGVSFISAEKACSFKASEIMSWKLNDTVSAAVAEWNQDVFSKIQVPTDPSHSNKTNLFLLYSSLYFMHLMPSNRTGENPLWESDEPSWDDFYTLWDIFRCTVSLYHLLQPVAYEGIIRSLIDIWRFEGYMPDGRSGNYNGLVQGGSNSDNVLADAYVKGLRGSINWTDGYQAMVKNAEVIPYNTFSIIDLGGSVKEGRGALGDWLKVGYVASESTRCISRTVEYSLNDYSLSVVAAGEAPGDVQKYRQRSAGWQKIWKDDVTSHGFSGFLTPRFLNGSWDDDGYNPAKCDQCEWGSISYEGVPWEYTFTVPMDMESLVAKMGGDAEFERRMDHIFQPNTSEQNLFGNGAGITSIMNIGNEPDFATPYLYNYVNKQYKSVNQSRILANQYFHNSLYGVPGNSDAGALNSWLIWSMLGMYPVVTQTTYLLESPWFTDINMTVNGNATLRITSNGNPQTLGQEGFWVQSVKINGQEWTKNWFDHEDVMVHGGTIEFFVGESEKVWETGVVPPSPGHVELSP
ncbi:glycosyl hydrolase [Thozetella sp. PMI_491]|nr:glycosyl hydrolase [Thozetella sp. PMI_491]